MVVSSGLTFFIYLSLLKKNSKCYNMFKSNVSQLFGPDIAFFASVFLPYVAFSEMLTQAVKFFLPNFHFI